MDVISYIEKYIISRNWVIMGSNCMSFLTQKTSFWFFSIKRSNHLHSYTAMWKRCVESNYISKKDKNCYFDDFNLNLSYYKQKCTFYYYLRITCISFISKLSVFVCWVFLFLFIHRNLVMCCKNTHIYTNTYIKFLFVLWK